MFNLIREPFKGDNVPLFYRLQTTQMDVTHTAEWRRVRTHNRVLDAPHNWERFANTGIPERAQWWTSTVPSYMTGTCVCVGMLCESVCARVIGENGIIESLYVAKETAKFWVTRLYRNPSFVRSRVTHECRHNTCFLRVRKPICTGLSQWSRSSSRNLPVVAIARALLLVLAQ